MKYVVTLAAAAALALSANIASAGGQQLAQKYSCLTCHQVDRKVVGPAYRDVAKKYRGDAKAEEHLLQVIKHGGKGVWGPIPMPPSPQVPEADAKTIVKWILSL
jgi:cytochrome c